MESVGGGQAGRVAVEYMAIAMDQDIRILHELGGPVNKWQLDFFILITM